MNILFIVGSERKESFNRKLSLIAKEYLEEKGAKCTYLDYSDLPFFNQDIEHPAPQSVSRIRGEIKSADCIWFFTPEYNHSYPAIVKNLVDWLSRKEDGKSAINGKICAVSGIGGRGKTEEGRKKLIELLSFVSASVITETEGFAANPEAFGNDMLIISDDDIARVKRQADTILEKLG